jgi:hypothetical protein
MTTPGVLWSDDNDILVPVQILDSLYMIFWVPVVIRDVLLMIFFGIPQESIYL